MTSPQTQHDDPMTEARTQVVQALAVLTTVGEAAARWAANGAQNRAAKAEQRTRTGQLTDAARRQADKAEAAARTEQHRADRRLMDHAFDNTWLESASLHDTAQLWRTAAMHSGGGDARAFQAMRRAESRLRTLHPLLMDTYEQHRRAGRNMADAMRFAAREVWEHDARRSGSPTARPHGHRGDPPPALRAGANGRALLTRPDPNGQRLADELDAAVRAEVYRLADGIDPDMLDQIQRQWRSTGHPATADAAALLTQVAYQLRLFGPAAMANTIEDVAARAADAKARTLQARADVGLRQAGLDQATPDNPTTAINEHASGPATATFTTGTASNDSMAADQQRRLSRAFPPLRNVTPTFSAAPTAASSPTPSPRKGQAR